MENVCEGPPMALVVFKEDMLKEAAIAGLSQKILIPKDHLDIESILAILIAFYYSLDLNYPKEYIQPMGLLAKWVLEHKYYKLSSKTVKIDYEIAKCF